jgi:O-methyltransferase involved in polyketide biosynthesis
VTDNPSLAGAEPKPSAAADRPHPARMWNHWLGGKDNYAIDREVGDQIILTYPSIRDIARQSRSCLGRMVRYLAEQEGIRQFLDIGTGLPTVDNTHEVAQRIAPESKIVYMDNDPLVLAHAQVLLASTPEGSCRYFDCDVRKPDRVLELAAENLDFDRPIGLILFGILGNVVADGEAKEIVRRLVDALPSGSFLALNDGTGELDRAGREEAIRIAVEQGSSPYVARTPAQIAEFFTGLELLEPGVVSTSQWRPEPTPADPPEAIDSTCGLARKP